MGTTMHLLEKLGYGLVSNNGRAGKEGALGPPEKGLVDFLYLYGNDDHDKLQSLVWRLLRVEWAARKEELSLRLILR